MQDIQGDAPIPKPIPNQNKASGLWIALSFLVGGLIIIGAVVQASLSRTRTGGAPAELPQPRAASPAAAPSPVELSNNFRQVAKDVKPAVVNINIVETARRPPFFPGFGYPDDGYGRQRGTGSGAIVTPDGYILTNNHVVGKADKIEVTLADGRKFKGDRIGTDPETDLAIIKISATGLHTAVLGDSDLIEQGDWVLAIGSPFGLQQTITAGIVSATGRDLPTASQFSNRYIQTDASINPGNSGGPLVNMRGEVIGINTLIYSSSGGNEGVGFAIPSNLARKVYAELIQNGKMSRGYLGVGIKDLDAATADAMNLEAGTGVLVGEVRPDGPAAKGGLKTGDVITSIDGAHVKTVAELTNKVASTAVGRSVRVDYIRDGQRGSTTVVLAERPLFDRESSAEPGGGDAKPSRLGLTVQTVTPAMAKNLNLEIESGAVVVRVKPGSSAADALTSGDVIHQVGKDKIENADDLVRVTESLKSGQDVAVRIERNGRLAWVTISVD